MLLPSIIGTLILPQIHSYPIEYVAASVTTPVVAVANTTASRAFSTDSWTTEIARTALEAVNPVTVAEARESASSTEVVLETKPKPVKAKALAPEQIQSKIDMYAAMYGVDPALMTGVVAGESRFVVCAMGDHGNSWGLVQINLPSNDGVTKDQACDPDFALRFLAEGLSQGDCVRWTACRNLTGISLY